MKTSVPARADQAMRNPQEISHLPHSAVPSTPELTLDITALKQAASDATWATGQHQLDAVVSLASEWLRTGEPYLPPDPEVLRLLKRFADHHVAWKGAMAHAIAVSKPGHNRECMQQVVEMLGFAARVGERVSTQSTQDAQRLMQIARMMAPESKAPTAYFKRPSAREPLRQCRSTDVGAIPMYLDPQVAMEPVVQEQNHISRYKAKLGYVFQLPIRVGRYVRQAAINAWYPYDGEEDKVDKYA
jgi:hypothetical protein